MHACAISGPGNDLRCWGNVKGWLGYDFGFKSPPNAFNTAFFAATSSVSKDYLPYLDTIDDQTNCETWPGGWAASNTRYGQPASCFTLSRPVRAIVKSNVVRVSAGKTHSCLILGDMRVECWGM